VGLAALANMGLIQTITFGLAGHELAHLFFKRYGVSDDFLQTYAGIASQVAPEYTKMLMGLVSRAIQSGTYDENAYVPVSVFRRVLQMQVEFLHHDLAVEDVTFLTGYLWSLKKVSNGKAIPAAWIEQVKTVQNLEEKAEAEL
jgi:hypothetical protein